MSTMDNRTLHLSLDGIADLLVVATVGLRVEGVTLVATAEDDGSIYATLTGPRVQISGIEATLDRINR